MGTTKIEPTEPGRGGKQLKLRAVKKLARVALADDEAKAITELRLAVLANGYTPIPNRDKRTMFKGWPALDPDEPEIRGWIHPRASLTIHPATGFLVVDELATIDCDIPDEAIAREVREAIAAIAPQLFGGDGTANASRGALVRGRDDGSPKTMLFCRRAGKPFTIRSKRWSATGSEGGATFVVEIFASDRDPFGKARRQVGAFGPHTVDDETGEVKIRYEWRGPSPAEVPKANLPEIDEATALAIAEAVDRILEAHGLQEVVGHPGGNIVPKDVYDLDDASRFDGADFSQVDLEGLAEIYWQNQPMGWDTRCSGSFTDEHAKRMDRCHVGWSGSRRSGHLTVHDYATEITHRPADRKPIRDFLIADIMELIDARRGVSR